MQQEIVNLRDQLAMAQKAFSELQEDARAEFSQIATESAALQDANQHLKAENLHLGSGLQSVRRELQSI